VSLQDDQHVANLDRIDHVVVVMLENRSFDHMLGYLSLVGGRTDVDGLSHGLSNCHEGHRYDIHRLGATALDFDPAHDCASIDKQIADGAMDGFVSSAAANMAARGIQDRDPGCVLGYYDAGDVPVYDHFAAQFAVCDRWFSSIAGSTFPNRLYALSGAAAGSRDEPPGLELPIYHRPSFVRHLDALGISWAWYSFDPGILRFVDANYRLGHRNRFGYFSKTGLPWRSRLDIEVNRSIPSFLEDAADGRLPAVSWIDPAFTNFNPLGFPVNDDHAPADVADGQDLVLATYDALASSPLWERCLLLVVYDEHGGFYDHVPPPAAMDDGPAEFRRFGVRVPAMVISPWIRAGTVTHTVFDHTSIIKTILLRFAPLALELPPLRHPRLAPNAPQHPGLRVMRANHLGELLTAETPRVAPSRDALLQQARTRSESATERSTANGRPHNDLQQHILAATRELARHGHPGGEP
jgi:phospholipase C